MSESPNRDGALLHLLQGPNFKPVFIIGDHRSGTTLLHRLLVETGCFNYVSAYQVMRYNEVLANHSEGRTEAAKRDLMALFERMGLKDRVIDNTPATPDSPVEYGFIFATTQKRMARLTADTHDKFNELAKKMQYVGDHSKPLLLKNPWDVMNFMDIKAFLPEAKFIFIHRHPVAIMTSQMRAIRSLLAARNGFVSMLAPWYDKLFDRPLQLWAARFFDRPPVRIWERLLGLHTVRMADYYLKNIGRLAPSDYVSVKYEGLCQAPDETMQRIFDYAGVTPGQPMSYEGKIEPRPPKVVEDVWRQYRKIVPRLRPYLEYHGYEAEPDWMRR
ncbi:MAG: sulfotransferase [Bryobacteraceae bacterium]